MKLFLDSSAFAKRFIEEPGTREVEALCSQADELCLSVLCVPEIVSALNRRRREEHVGAAEYSRIKQRLAEEVRDAVVVNLTPDVVGSSVAILEATAVRTMDALQIACALAWGADVFATADRRQEAAAAAAGLRTRLV